MVVPSGVPSTVQDLMTWSVAIAISTWPAKGGLIRILAVSPAL